MANSSDGYIMIDFAEVDFRRTNQTIEGLFARCQKVIGTNKFVIVINANGKTPLPSAVSITNGQYVIESVLFNFTISSNDNLNIKKLTPVNEIIDDNHEALNTTWSSTKINNTINAAVSDFKFIELSATLYSGQNTYTWQDQRITSDMWVFPFTSVYGLNPKTLSCVNGSLTMTFDEHEIDITIGARLY